MPLKKQDYQEAKRLLEKSAGQGEAEAQFALGFMYYNGWGVAVNREEAIKWLHKAAQQGHARAAQALAEIGE